MVSLNVKVPDGRSAVLLTPADPASSSAEPPPQAISTRAKIVIHKRPRFLFKVLISPPLK